MMNYQMSSRIRRIRFFPCLYSTPSICPSRVSFFKRACSIARSVHTSQQNEPEHIPLDVKIEEETLPHYRAERYYPVHIGDVFQSRYKIITKLGYGTISTVWLCRDLLNDCYLTLKAHVRTKKPPPEVVISKHLNSIKIGGTAQFVRTITDSFDVRGEHGVFSFLLYPPAGVDFDDLMHMFQDKMFNEDLLKAAVRDTLTGMDFMHKADVIHTDIHASNILLGIGEGSTLADLEAGESFKPSTRKILADRTIYLSRYMPVTYGRPMIADLGEARIAREKQTGLVMPDVYRAPEVSFCIDWDNKIDIWAIGLTMWSLLQGNHLFKNRDSLNDSMDRAHRMAEMISLIGPPPAEFLQRSPETLEYWDKNGDWKGLVPIPDESLETREKRLTGSDKAAFLGFMRKALQWLPEDRPTAEELLSDEWVRGDLY